MAKIQQRRYGSSLRAFSGALVAAIAAFIVAAIFDPLITAISHRLGNRNVALGIGYLVVLVLMAASILLLVRTIWLTIVVARHRWQVTQERLSDLKNRERHTNYRRRQR